MRTKELCHKLLSKTSIHQKRISVISEIVETILESKELGVTQVGRKMNNHCQTRSNIRKVDRLYSNIHLPKEHEVISQCLSEWLIVNPKPLLVVDGSKISNSQWYLLRASLVAQGRAICIFEMIYTQRENASLRLYKRFLRKLNGILPSSCKPILITDAEFRGPWFKAVTALGWDYVGRLRGDRKCALEREKFTSLENIRKQATNQSTYLGYGFLNIQHPQAGYFYSYKAPSKGRHAHTRSGCHSDTEKSRKQAKAAKEPWIIFSSLKQSPSQIIKAYGYRMTIEENFRDLKSGRYGLGLEMTHSKHKNRYQVMLILAMLAAVIAYLIGFVAEHHHVHYQFQSNSVKNKRVLSRFFLGCEIIYRNLIFPISIIISAIDSLQHELYDSFRI